MQAERDTQYSARDKLEAAFNTTHPDGFGRLTEEVREMKQHSLYCGTCRHGNGCEHNVPASRQQSGLW
jgi:hypothetical protein